MLFFLRKLLSVLPILVSGGSPNRGKAEAEVMRDVLEQEFHVPVQWLETSSRVTGENAALSMAMLAKSGITSVALVTDAVHMPRAKLEFERVGLTDLFRCCKRCLNITCFSAACDERPHNQIQRH